MNIFSAFPSEFLRACDLQDRAHTVVMERVEIKKVGDVKKPVLYFQGKEKGLALNITNSNTIATIYGEETDDWTGRELVLFPTMTDFKGEQTDCIRVRSPQPKERTMREVRAVPTNGAGRQQAPARQEFNDEVPF